MVSSVSSSNNHKPWVFCIHRIIDSQVSRSPRCNVINFAEWQAVQFARTVSQPSATTNPLSGSISAKLAELEIIGDTKNTVAKTRAKSPSLLPTRIVTPLARQCGGRHCWGSLWGSSQGLLSVEPYLENPLLAPKPRNIQVEESSALHAIAAMLAYWRAF